MAKHFREDAPTQTKLMERPANDVQSPRMGGTGHVSLPYGQAATYHYSYPSAAVRGDDFYEEEWRPRGGIFAVARGLLLIIAWTLRLVAVALFVLTMLNIVSLSFIEVPVTRVTDILTSYFPWRTIGLLAIDTPFGGVFRGDLSLLMLLFFLLDWLVCRLRSSLR